MNVEVIQGQVKINSVVCCKETADVIIFTAHCEEKHPCYFGGTTRDLVFGKGTSRDSLTRIQVDLPELENDSWMTIVETVTYTIFFAFVKCSILHAGEPVFGEGDNEERKTQI